MKKLSYLLLLSLVISCQSPQKDQRTPANDETVEGIEGTLDCSINNKGCLLKRESDTVIVFFRGWVSPNEMSRYRGERKRLNERYWVPASRDILTRGEIPLGKGNLTSSIFATGSAHLGLTMEEMDQILQAANAKYLVFASHSGGYKGLRATILPAKLEYWEKVTGIWLLDNYYGAQAFANDLKRNFGETFLRENCYGFVTDHNMSKYRSSYKSFCPKTRTSGVTHSGGVLTCMPFFEQNESCQ